MHNNLSQALDIFLLDCQARRLTKSTLEFYRIKVNHFIKWLDSQAVSTLANVTATHIRRYLVQMADDGYADTSQHDHARALKTFFGFCVREELLVKTPFDKIRMPKLADRLPVVLTDADIATVFKKTSSQRNRLIVRFILDSGVRAAELIALNVADVDFASGVVTVRQGKQQKDRLTHVGNTTRKEIKKYLMQRSYKDTDPLFVSERGGGRLTMAGLMSAFRLTQQETGIEALAAHTLRRTMATKAIENGMNIYVLAKMLGHADTQMLKKYVAVSRDTIQNQADKFGVVDNLK